MLIEQGSLLYAYSITRDLGFAPNPFHGTCTLATCKPGIRNAAKLGDWVLGIGGYSLGKVKSKCILLMKVTDKCSFQAYWDNPEFAIKKPLRNGSCVRMLGDNIYHKDSLGSWIQEDSHHSNSDGTMHQVNMERDTKADNVLLSNFFLYFGDSAISIDLESIGYYRIRDFKRYNLTETNEAGVFLKTIVNKNIENVNQVIADPCQFKESHKRVDQSTGLLY